MRIREYEAADFEASRSLWSELTLHHQEIYEDSAIAGDDPGRGFDTYINNPACRNTWVAELNGQVVGFTGLIVNWGEGEIEPVIVSSPYRNRGIGTMLVQRVVEEAKKTEVRFLSIRPVARNERAVSLFAKLGFNLVGHINLFQDISPSSDRKWKRGIEIHGNELCY